MTSSHALPLLVTADPSLRDQLLRLCAAAGVTPELADDAVGCLRSWIAAPLVLLGADLAPAVADLQPVRRGAVHVVAPGRAADGLFRDAVRLGAAGVVELPRSEAWLVETLTDLDEPRPGGLVLGVTGGSGGAGATTFACALGQLAAADGDAVVIDCDPLGPGVDRVLGLEHHEGFRWDALCQTTGRLSARALREALPRAGGLGVLSWYAGGRASPLQAFAAREALSASRRGHETVVLDLPRGADPLVEELAARCDLVLVLAVPSVAGVAAAARTCARFSEVAGASLVLRGTGVPAEEVARATGVPVLAQMQDQRALAESIDLGLGPVRHPRGRLGRAATEVLVAARAAHAALAAGRTQAA